MSALQSLPISDTNRREMKRFIKFSIVGVAGMATHLTILNLLLFFAHFAPIVANAIGFSAAVVQNFFLNRNWTFPETRNRQAGKQLLQFAAVSVAGLLINSTVFFVVHTLTEPFFLASIQDPQLFKFVSVNFATACAILVTLFWNFTVNRLWTFRSHEPRR
ncbi:MAG: GtrA family protein [Anaerolineales bacterium]|nr:GtrA family protein [Anaerolineales bacterium]